ncbi:hypothetical protein Vretimale_14232 [Volvox reticuliferus]|uniref:Fe2OG dioxygenase domain-containing protein n=1 Tax=Volvox reticuliferus TaxID=1737510 RepID=A0A8J4GP60_9CHLO|nr:hypothetical protein Vretifemale_15229 [Volvox reticuliferus]GIM10607.1 hypothetical protein Vretimale_14232 [Volvox reticuliferus]
MSVASNRVWPLGSIVLRPEKLSSALYATATSAPMSTLSPASALRQRPATPCWLRNTRHLWREDVQMTCNIAVQSCPPHAAERNRAGSGTRPAASRTLLRELRSSVLFATAAVASHPLHLISPSSVLRPSPVLLAPPPAAGPTPSMETIPAAATKSPRTPNIRQKQQKPGRHTADAMPPEKGAVLFIGFHHEELDVVRQQLPKLLTQMEDGGTTSVLDITYGMLSYTVPEVLLCQELAASGTDNSYGSIDANGPTAVAAGRVILLVGPAARSLGAQLNDLLVEWGVVPALIAAYQPRHEGMPLRRLVTFLRDSHAAYYGLLQPVRVESPQQPPPPAVAGGDEGGGFFASSSSGATSAADVAGAAGNVATNQWRALEDVRVILCAAMDAGEVPSIHGHYRRDAGHVVVLDGLLTVPERRQLLDWLTAEGHDHAGAPPEDKWERVCVDHEGAKPTWGLQPHVLQALRDHPPPPVVALQTRLAALYPEYDICHMPADQISDEYGSYDNGGGAGTPLSSFVGNAVMAGDPCAWHSDADPTTVPPHSPWVHNFGYYHNRELARPLFVSMLLYLNETWPEDHHAETLFLDPETQLGLFVRPAPGRVVLLEQDLPHRISAPSLEAPGPRYSLVWKLVLVPRSCARGPDLSGGGDSGEAPVNGPDGEVVMEGAMEGEREGQREGMERGCAASESEFQSICRPEWGEPVRIGSANSRCGIPAFQRGRRQ